MSTLTETILEQTALDWFESLAGKLPLDLTSAPTCLHLAYRSE